MIGKSAIYSTRRLIGSPGSNVYIEYMELSLRNRLAAGVRSPRIMLVVIVAVAGWAVASRPFCSHSQEPTSADSKSISFHPRKHPAEFLPNLVQVHPCVYSGGTPEGAPAFQELQTLGVQTVISVDGAKPDVATARQFGLRYVHLPHGYDGIPPRRAAELAKAVQDLPGRIYIHCHHGQHRSPAAATVACIVAGMVDPAAAESILQLAGTSPEYRGLFRSTTEAVPADPEFLKRLQVDFRETVELPPLAESMVTIERIHDRLIVLANNRWRVPAGRSRSRCPSSSAHATRTVY